MDDDLKAILELYRASKEKPVEKWDHNGFMMLYPDGGKASTSVEQIKQPKDGTQIPICIDKLEKWDHAGFNILYSKNKTGEKKTKHKKKK